MFERMAEGINRIKRKGEKKITKEDEMRDEREKLSIFVMKLGPRKLWQPSHYFPSKCIAESLNQLETMNS